MLSMLVDHIGVLFLARTPYYLPARIIGRCAFPVFCFLLAEGFSHTSNRKRYVIRMAVFALLSEVPFDLAFKGKVIEFSHQNVFVTLALGLLLLMATDYCRTQIANQTQGMLLEAAAVLAAAGIAWVVRCDYSMMGVLLIYGIYTLKPYGKWYQFVYMAGILLLDGGIEGYACMAILPLALYNGRYGVKSKMLQYGFYAFYPVHLLVLYNIIINLNYS